MASDFFIERSKDDQDQGVDWPSLKTPKEDLGVKSRKTFILEDFKS